MITAVVIAVFVVSGRSRVDQWQRKGPALYERVNDGLDAEVGPLPDDGILFVTNVPIELALYDGYPMRFLLRYRSPDTNTEVVWFDGQQIDSIRAQLRPQDRIFLFRNRDG